MYTEMMHTAYSRNERNTGKRLHSREKKNKQPGQGPSASRQGRYQTLQQLKGNTAQPRPTGYSESTARYTHSGNTLIQDPFVMSIC